MKGIILAGGNGTRLHPLTLVTSKQLLPIYNKPMVYYPLSVLMLAGIRQVLIIATSASLPQFQYLFRDGSHLGMDISYAKQDRPNGLAEAFIIGKEFIGTSPVCLILGDNIFYGNQLVTLLQKAAQKTVGATLFGYEVKDPHRYGVVEFNSSGQILSIEEKPKHPKSSVAVTGLYFYDNQVVDIASRLQPSLRGELEITDINNAYLQQGQASLHVMGRGFTWLDAGTYDSLMQASQFVQMLEERQGLYIAALEEIAYRQGFISREDLTSLSRTLGNNHYSEYLLQLAQKEGATDGHHLS